MSWIRGHWMRKECQPLISDWTEEELVDVLSRPKFNLHPSSVANLLSDYLPYCTRIHDVLSSPLKCRDLNDKPFLDLALAGQAQFLVSSDKDLLVLAGSTPFTIYSPADYARLFRKL